MKPIEQWIDDLQLNGDFVAGGRKIQEDAYAQGPEQKELRELDAWIAEHVFGWVRMRDQSGEVELVEPRLTDYMAKRFGLIKTNNIWTIADVPKYSTNPADAMAVLEKCAKKIEEVKMETDCIQIQWYDGQWNACAFEGDIPTCSADTLPLAIALFAKKLFEK